MDRLPSTQDALNQHIRYAYIQVQVWSSSHLAIIPEKNPKITDEKRLAMCFGLPDGQPYPKLFSPVERLYDAVAKSNVLGAATARAAHLSGQRYVFTMDHAKYNGFLRTLSVSS